jgi:hypothetical protein
MRLLLLSVSIACLTANALLATPAIDHIDLGRETLATNDGWASFSTGTTGGQAQRTIRSTRYTIDVS